MVDSIYESETLLPYSLQAKLEEEKEVTILFAKGKHQAWEAWKLKVKEEKDSPQKSHEPVKSE